MKTEHFNLKYSWGDEFQTELGREIIKEMKRLGTFDRNLRMRMVTCGKAVIFLPETDTSKDCTINELLKAMHREDKKDEFRPQGETKRYFVKDSYNEDHLFMDVSPQVDEFIKYCSRNDYFSDDITFTDPNEIQAVKF